MAYMSQEGYDKLVAQLKQLESVERPKASAAIAEARDKGDLSENSEYDAAKTSLNAVHGLFGSDRLHDKYVVDESEERRMDFKISGARW